MTRLPYSHYKGHFPCSYRERDLLFRKETYFPCSHSYTGGTPRVCARSAHTFPRARALSPSLSLSVSRRVGSLSFQKSRSLSRIVGLFPYSYSRSKAAADFGEGSAAHLAHTPAACCWWMSGWPNSQRRDPLQTRQPLCVCVCVCCVYMYVSMYVCMYVCICT